MQGRLANVPIVSIVLLQIIILCLFCGLVCRNGSRPTSRPRREQLLVLCEAQVQFVGEHIAIAVPLCHLCANLEQHSLEISLTCFRPAIFGDGPCNSQPGSFSATLETSASTGVKHPHQHPSQQASRCTTPPPLDPLSDPVTVCPPRHHVQFCPRPAALQRSPSGCCTCARPPTRPRWPQKPLMPALIAPRKTG